MRIINDIYKVTCRFCLFVFFVLVSCAIENDIPYPIVNAGITDIRVEGQRPAEGSSDDAALIDASAKTILLYVNDSADISRLKLTRLVVNPTPDSPHWIVFLCHPIRGSILPNRSILL